MMKSFIVLLMTASVSLTAFSQAQYDTLPNLPQHYTDRLAKFRKEPVVNGKIIFAGNSITEGGNWRKLLKDSSVLNRGISGDNTFGLLRRVDEIIRHKPAKLFILIGVNDFSKDIPTDRTLENIFSIIKQIQAGSSKTKIFVQSILPVNPAVKTFPARFAKQNSITEVNGQLKRYAETLKYTYVDIYNQFTEAKNVLDTRFTYDGLHLNAAGYVHWVEYLKKEGYL